LPHTQQVGSDAWKHASEQNILPSEVLRNLSPGLISLPHFAHFAFLTAAGGAPDAEGSRIPAHKIEKTAITAAKTAILKAFRGFFMLFTMPNVKIFKIFEVIYWIRTQM